MSTLLKFVLVLLGIYFLIGPSKPLASDAALDVGWNAFQLIFAWKYANIQPYHAKLRSEECIPAACFALLKQAAPLQSSNRADAEVCGSWDPSSQPGVADPSQRVMVALNLHNNEDVMPHMVRQLLHLVAQLGPQRAFVSIYESGSTDRTPAYLELLAGVLVRCGVPHRILTGSQFRLEPGASRIEFMATIRNLALEPLWGDSAALKSSSRFLSNISDLSTPVPAERVVFINDVFWCVKHVLRLLAYDSDMACGMDFYVTDYLDLRTFYDSWVSRAIDGSIVTGKPPYVQQHRLSAHLLGQGRPIPMRCCWNGLAVLRAKPFLEGVRFREHAEGECAASECSILCDDLWHRNYTDFVMDPAVAVAYDPVDARALAREQRVNEVFWRVQDAAAYRHGMKQQHLNSSVMCCDLPPGHLHVDMETDCRSFHPVTTATSAAARAAVNKSEM